MERKGKLANLLDKVSRFFRKMKDKDKISKWNTNMDHIQYMTSSITSYG